MLDIFQEQLFIFLFLKKYAMTFNFLKKNQMLKLLACGRKHPVHLTTLSLPQHLEHSMR